MAATAAVTFPTRHQGCASSLHPSALHLRQLYSACSLCALTAAHPLLPASVDALITSSRPTLRCCPLAGLPPQDEVSLASRLQTLRERGSDQPIGTRASVYEEQWTQEHIVTDRPNVVTKQQCECATQAEHQTRWTEANQDNEANGDLWAQSHYMHCILTGLREAACHFPDVPTVTKPELCAGVAKASCEDYSASISATALTAAPAAQVDDIGETIDLEGLSCDSEWTDCRGCSSTGAYCGTPSGAQGEEGGQTAIVVCGEAKCTSR